jgi:hypothetical protein
VKGVKGNCSVVAAVVVMLCVSMLAASCGGGEETAPAEVTPTESAPPTEEPAPPTEETSPSTAPEEAGEGGELVAVVSQTIENLSPHPITPSNEPWLNAVYDPLVRVDQRLLWPKAGT